MFTGIIKEIGQVSNIKKEREVLRLEIESEQVIKDLDIGSSVAIDGVCQTVVAREMNKIVVQVVPETLDLTTFGNLKVGEQVNLESSLKLQDDISGHLLTGHVDGVGKIVDVKKEDDTAIFTIKPPENLQKFIALKGSIALDGISLTIAKCNDQQFSVAIIPHTLKETTLGIKKVGDSVNLEVDILAKYVGKMLSMKDKGLNEAKLKEAGF